MRAPLSSVHANRSGHGGDVSTEWVDHWTAKAACIGVDPELFFVDEFDNPSARLDTDLAKAVCGRCEVRPECLQTAIDNGERYGVFGGMTTRERLVATGRRKRLRLPAVHGTASRARQHRRDGESPCVACRDAERLEKAERKERAS